MIIFPTLNLMFLQGKVLFDFEEVFNTVFLENENVCICVGNSDSSLIIKYIAMSFELPEDGDQLEHVGARQGEIYVSIICAFVGTERF